VGRGRQGRGWAPWGGGRAAEHPRLGGRSPGGLAAKREETDLPGRSGDDSGKPASGDHLPGTGTCRNGGRRHQFSGGVAWGEYWVRLVGGLGVGGSGAFAECWWAWWTTSVRTGPERRPGGRGGWWYGASGTCRQAGTDGEPQALVIAANKRLAADHQATFGPLAGTQGGPEWIRGAGLFQWSGRERDWRQAVIRSPFAPCSHE
jgi:hypothetical protein